MVAFKIMRYIIFGFLLLLRVIILWSKYILPITSFVISLSYIWFTIWNSYSTTSGTVNCVITLYYDEKHSSVLVQKAVSELNIIFYRERLLFSDETRALVLEKALLRTSVGMYYFNTAKPRYLLCLVSFETRQLYYTRKYVLSSFTALISSIGRAESLFKSFHFSGKHLLH